MEKRETAFCWRFTTCSLNSCASNCVSVSSSSVSSGSVGSSSLLSWSSSAASISLSSPARYLKRSFKITRHLVNTKGQYYRFKWMAQ